MGRVCRSAKLIRYDGGMKTKPSDKPREYVEAWIGYLYKNVTGYAETAGELNAILWHLHHLWAGFADRNGEWVRTRSNFCTIRMWKRIPSNDPISNLEVQKMILKMWKKIDRKMGLDPQFEQYDQFIKP